LIKYGKNENKLDDNQRKKVIDLINSKDKKFDFALIKKTLNIYETFNYPNDFKVEGNYTKNKLTKLFKKDILEQKIEEIWHCFHFYSDNQKLYEKLCKDFEFKALLMILKK